MLLIHPSLVDAPHKVTRPEQVDELAESMLQHGWQGDKLVGYWLNGRVQLLSGTHRRAAALLLDRSIPVVMHPYEHIEAAWGTEGWADIMASGR